VQCRLDSRGLRCEGKLSTACLEANFPKTSNLHTTPGNIIKWHRARRNLLDRIRSPTPADRERWLAARDEFKSSRAGSTGDAASARGSGAQGGSQGSAGGRGRQREGQGDGRGEPGKKPRGHGDRDPKTRKHDDAPKKKKKKKKKGKKARSPSRSSSSYESDTGTDGTEERRRTPRGERAADQGTSAERRTRESTALRGRTEGSGSARARSVTRSDRDSSHDFGCNRNRGESRREDGRARTLREEQVRRIPRDPRRGREAVLSLQRTPPQSPRGRREVLEPMVRVDMSARDLHWEERARVAARMRRKIGVEPALAAMQVIEDMDFEGYVPIARVREAERVERGGRRDVDDSWRSPRPRSPGQMAATRGSERASPREPEPEHRRRDARVGRSSSPTPERRSERNGVRERAGPQGVGERARTPHR